MITVLATEPTDPQAVAILQQSHALMQELFDPQDNFFLSVEDLCADNIHFYAAYDDGTMMGTGAIAIMENYAEIKSLFVIDAARGKGVAAALMRQLEDIARDADVKMIKLETGDLLDAAQRLYARNGFVTCGPFGAYPNASSSVFMEKPL